jgi:hypothetical protein
MATSGADNVAAASTTVELQERETRTVARSWLLNKIELLSDISPTDGRRCLTLSTINAFYDAFIDYVAGHQEAPLLMMSRTDFFSVWESNFPHVKIIDDTSGRRNLSQP